MGSGGRRWEREGGEMKVGVDGPPFMDPRYAPAAESTCATLLSHSVALETVSGC